MTLPTREEIARIIHAQIVAGELARSDRHHTFEACGVQATYYRIADALLARWRPAWEQMEQRVIDAAEIAQQRKADLEISHDVTTSFFAALKPLELTEINVADPGEHVTALIGERDALRADLRACAEALVQYGQHKPTCPVNGDGRFSASAWLVVTNPQPCDCGLATALARPGVREALT